MSPITLEEHHGRRNGDGACWREASVAPGAGGSRTMKRLKQGALPAKPGVSPSGRAVYDGMACRRPIAKEGAQKVLILPSNAAISLAVPLTGRRPRRLSSVRGDPGAALGE